MKKRNIIFGCLFAACLFGSVSANAYDIAGPLKINNRVIYCESEKPVIINDRMLVSINKIMNYGGIKVKYVESKSQIFIDSDDNIKRLSMYLDKPTLEIYTYKSVLSAEREDVTLDVAPQLIDGVPMFPIRPIAEALGYEIFWDSETDTVCLNTKSEEEISENRCLLSISADKDDVSKGDTVTITMKLSDLSSYSDLNLTAITGSIIYDTQKFEYVSTQYVPGSDSSVIIEASNPFFNNYAAKSVAVIKDYALDGSDLDVLSMTFEALTDDGGEFILSDYYNTLRGADNDFIFTDAERKSSSVSDDTTLIIDKTPIIIK